MSVRRTKSPLTLLNLMPLPPLPGLWPSRQPAANPTPGVVRFDCGCELQRDGGDAAWWTCVRHGSFDQEIMDTVGGAADFCTVGPWSLRPTPTPKSVDDSLPLTPAERAHFVALLTPIAHALRRASSALSAHA